MSLEKLTSRKNYNKISVGKEGVWRMNKRARKKRTKRIIKATCFALAVAAFSTAFYGMQLKEVNIDYLGKNVSFKTFASTVSEALKERDIRLLETEDISTGLTNKLARNNNISIYEKPIILAAVAPAAPVIELPVVEEAPIVVEEKKEEKKEEKVDRSTTPKKSTASTSRGNVRTSWGPDVIKREEGVLEASDGTLIEYEGVMQLEATAYCACYECCGKWPGNKWYGITATGTRAKVGTIAVDPRVIPLGTKVYVEGLFGAENYGYATAEDTGGAIKGNIIDLYFNTHRETINWGRQQVNVYILKDNTNALIASVE